MLKRSHEVRDPIHVFIRYNTDERNVIDSLVLQRLRHIHQLGMTYLIYPGATHRRFEHSLGVMELAGRLYDVVTSDSNVDPSIKEVLPEIKDVFKKTYWRCVIRMAGLCHDVGHLPFSHVAEKDLLPAGMSHENLTVNLIKSDMMRPLWDYMKLNPDDIAKIAVGPNVLKTIKFTDWESLLSEIIVGDAFGVDRMDYLLRDSHHAGVMYGRFDHYRLIDNIKILPKSAESSEPTLGIDEGGIHSAEALLLARYFMFIQVYLHHVRRIYDIHLKDFLVAWLDGGNFTTDLKSFLEITDNEVTKEFFSAARDESNKGYETAKRIVFRDHFRVLYSRNPIDLNLHLQPGRVIYEAAADKFGSEYVRYDSYAKEGGALDFPVQTRDGRIISSLVSSQTLNDIPSAAIDFVFIDSIKRDEANKWLEKNREKLLKKAAKKEKEK